jgi:hypothetical protein
MTADSSKVNTPVWISLFAKWSVRGRFVLYVAAVPQAQKIALKLNWLLGSS